MKVQGGTAKKQTRDERQAWRVCEFCEAHRISRSTFWKYAALGRIRTIKIGGRVLIPADEARRIATEGL
jgi:predicted site-specific integrase-resolvase